MTPELHNELTPRQLEVIKLLAAGRSAKEAAQYLGVTDKTIESHITYAMAKLQIRTRTVLVHYALHHGWVKNIFDR